MIQQNIFEAVKQSVTPWQAASFYGLKQNREHMCRCLFHRDRHPSMKLYDDHFYCFGCGKAGDVTALTAELLCISQIDAAKRLCEDFGIDMPRDQHPITFVPLCRDITVPDKQECRSSSYRPDLQEEVLPENDPLMPEASLPENRAEIIRGLLRYRQITEKQMQELSHTTPNGEWSDAFCKASEQHSRTGHLLDMLLFGTEQEANETIKMHSLELEGILGAARRFNPGSC